MVIVVVVLNTLISLGCFYVAWRIRKLRRQLAKIADTLTVAERRTHAVLGPSPRVISKGQKGINRLNERYQRLEPQVQKVRQVLALVSQIQKIWPLPMGGAYSKRSRSQPWWSKLLKRLR
jgi:hypothetical protein